MNELYVFTIYPIELIYKLIYLVLVSFTENYGLALFALSFLNYFLLMPLNKLVRGLQESESNIQQILAPQLQRIRETSRDAARHQRVQNLYQRYSYHPIFAMRNVFPLLVQLPFLMAVYFMLSSLTNLEGVSFLFLQNLSKPDALFFGLNLMPLVMTLVSLVNACFVVKLSNSQRKQAIVVALLFFVLLYSAPSALLLYWTMNNVLIIVFSFLSKISFVDRAKFFVQGLKKRFLPSIIESSGLLLGLSCIVPLYFTLSLNVNMFTDIQITNFTIFIICIFISSLAIGIILDKLIKLSSKYSFCLKLPFALSFQKNATKSKHTYHFSLNNFLYIGIALASIFCLTVVCLNIKDLIQNMMVVNIVRFSLVVTFYFIIRKFSFKIVNICMVSLFAFCCIQFAHSNHKNVVAAEILNNIANESVESFPLSEKLTNRPNIYLILLESYMGSTVLNDTYKIDNSAFENTLKDHQFEIFNNVYSHASLTKGTLLSLFLMRCDIYDLFIGDADVIFKAHDVFGGSKTNMLYSYLKKNDYIISSNYFYQGAFIKSKEHLLDHCGEDIDNSLISVIRDIAPSLSFRFKRVRQLLGNDDEPYDYLAHHKECYELALAHLDVVKGFNKPSFYLIKPPNVLHFNTDVVSKFKNYQEWISANVYHRGTQASNKEILTMVNKIEENDPNALIILFGDHGFRYARAYANDRTFYNMTVGEIKENYPQLNMTSQEIVDDMFSVFLAIKMPKEAKGKLVIDSNFALADLFKHVFAALEDKDVFLEHRSPNVSMNFQGDVMRRGDKTIDDAQKLK